MWEKEENVSECSSVITVKSLDFHFRPQSSRENNNNFRSICFSAIASSEYNLAISWNKQNAFIVYYCRIHFGWWLKESIKFEKANYFDCYYDFPIP